MKPFNLSEAIKGEKVVTRSGDKVLLTDISIKEKIIYGIIKGNEIVGHYIWDLDGKRKEASNFDLFMYPENKKLWIGINPTPDRHGHYSVSHAMPSKEELKFFIYNKNYHLIEIEIEEKNEI